MNPDHFDFLQTWFCSKAMEVIRCPELLEDEAYRAMLTESGVYGHWWAGAFSRNGDEETILAMAASAFARDLPLPELTLPQRGRFALRLRLASRILRAYSNRNVIDPAVGWFPSKLYSMPDKELIEWLLTDAVGFLLEVFDETLAWEDGVGPLDTVDQILKFPPGS